MWEPWHYWALHSSPFVIICIRWLFFFFFFYWRSVRSMYPMTLGIFIRSKISELVILYSSVTCIKQSNRLRPWEWEREQDKTNHSLSKLLLHALLKTLTWPVIRVFVCKPLQYSCQYRIEPTLRHSLTRSTFSPDSSVSSTQADPLFMIWNRTRLDRSGVTSNRIQWNAWSIFHLKRTWKIKTVLLTVLHWNSSWIGFLNVLVCGQIP